MVDLGVLATVTVTRRAVASTVDAYGDPVEPSSSSVSRDVVTWWAAPRELQRLGLDHTTAARVFVSDEEIKGAEVGYVPDRITYESESWEVIRVEDYITEAGLTKVYTRRVE